MIPALARRIAPWPQARCWDGCQFLCYHAYTLWLFTASDMKTMVLPSAAFALFTALACGKLSLLEFMSRLPRILAWIWFNLLAFVVNNQRHATSIIEDSINKPWRPIPSGRVTPQNARVLGWFAYGLAITTSTILGSGKVETLFLMFLFPLYNDLGLGDRHWLTRNILNAFGFTSFAAGALANALQAQIPTDTLPWMGIIATVVATTVHAQDMYDQPGDATAERRTIPLVFGDPSARWSIALAVMLWSWACPRYWELSAAGYVVLLALGTILSARTLTKRNIRDDRGTFRLYNGWLVTIYALPLLKRYSR